jgi:hypothetical protein
MNDYVARAREASRRWRAEHGLPPREEELSALPALSAQGNREKSRETLAHGVNAIEATKETKEKNINESICFLSFSPETDLRQKSAEGPTLALRRAHRELFALTVCEADGDRVTPATAQVVHQQIVKLTDEAGPLWAGALFAEELRRFRWETARCGFCGGLGHPQEHA